MVLILGTVSHTYTRLTDLEAVFRSLKSELGLRPIYHHRQDRAEGHLFITVLAYQAVQVLRRSLKEHEIQESWSTLRRIFAGQSRISATFRQTDGRTLRVRKTTVAEPKLQQLYETFGLSTSPGKGGRWWYEVSCEDVVTLGFFSPIIRLFCRDK